MANRETLKTYLVVENGYLLSSDNNNKTIMLSGKWGSGKTYFWNEDIIPTLNKDNNKIPNHYISLYGKTSIEEIKTEIFIKIFESVDSSPNFQNKAMSLAENTVGLINLCGFGNISKALEKPLTNLKDMFDNEQLKKTVTYLNNGAIICFDDFERKSKDIDLNDLFGFISQLTIEFNCKVVIILNEDVFEGKEKTVFSNVKEKTVSKFLNYTPDIKELFNLIFNSNQKYKKLNEYKDVIIETIKETKKLNARIYIHVLDNLFEWKSKNKPINNDIIRCIILANINFIIYHTITIIPRTPNDSDYIKIKSFPLIYREFINKYFHAIKGNHHCLPFEELIVEIKNEIHQKESITNTQENIDKQRNRNWSEKQVSDALNFIDNNLIIFKSLYFVNKYNLAQNITYDELIKINNFIETGILIEEK